MIPYTVERRPDTGVTNVTMGVWLLVAAEVMLFGALFSSFALLRTSAPIWPDGADVLIVPAAFANTVLIAAIALASRRAARVEASRTGPWLVASLVTALAVLLVQLGESAMLAAQGRRPAVGNFFALYFTLTAVHAVHVLAGAAACLWVLVGRRHVSSAVTRGRTRALQVYWTFVAAVWIMIVALFYAG